MLTTPVVHDLRHEVGWTGDARVERGRLCEDSGGVLTIGHPSRLPISRRNRRDVIKFVVHVVIDVPFSAGVRNDELVGEDEPGRVVPRRRREAARQLGCCGSGYVTFEHAPVLVVVVVEEGHVVRVGQRRRLVAAAAAAAAMAASDAADSSAMLALGEEDERDDDGERDERAERAAERQPHGVDRRRPGHARRRRVADHRTVIAWPVQCRCFTVHSQLHNSRDDERDNDNKQMTTAALSPQAFSKNT